MQTTESDPLVILDEDRERSYSANFLDMILPVISWAIEEKVHNILDVGCGYGGVALGVARCLRAREICGVDIDGRAVEIARQRGVTAHIVDIDQEKLPWPDDYFDVVTSFGVLDYFKTFDYALLEMHRVLRPSGWLVVSLPNLASWHNRLALLLGYQPRDVEISNRVLCGVHPVYKKRGDLPVGHLHTATASAFRELAEALGFSTVALSGLSGYPSVRGMKGRVLRLVARMLPKSMQQRFVFIGKKTDASDWVPPAPAGWWAEVEFRNQCWRRPKGAPERERTEQGS